MNQSEWGWAYFGIFVMLIVIASGIYQILGALAGIAGDLGSIRKEIALLSSDLDSARHPRIEDDPFA